MKNKIISLIKVVSLGFMLASAVVLWYNCLLSFSSPEYAVELRFNDFGEAKLELWLSSILIITSLFSCYSIILDMGASK